MVIVHLAGVRDDRDGVGLGQGGDFSGLGDAADTIGVKLNVIHAFILDEFAEAPEREFMLAAGNGDTVGGFELSA